MSDVDTTTLDELVERLERAAEQLRSGDLSADAAADARRGRAPLPRRPPPSSSAWRAPPRPRSRIPGQDSLL